MRAPPQRLLALFPGRHWIYGYLWRVANEIARQGGGHVSSWYRDPSVNRSVGGAVTSQHLLGLALDVSGPRLDRLEDAARRLWPGIVVREWDHIHLQLFPRGTIPSEVFKWAA